jgi:epoxyqueuosine reductase
MDLAGLARDIKQWGAELGFQAVGIADAELSAPGVRLAEWLEKGWHGEMDYMARHAALRAQPAALVAGTLRVLSCRRDYSAAQRDESRVLADGARANVARYARGRDYHKVLRSRLQRLCDRIEAAVGPFQYRVFSDSAPVMEVELAARRQRRGESCCLRATWTVLPGSSPASVAIWTAGESIASAWRHRRADAGHPGPYQLDARLCISYLTIELKGPIPEELRPLVGNRVYGCDDCQLCCPWNSFAQVSEEPDFRVRHGLDRATLVELFAWSESEFDERLRGSAIRRIGYERWLRNLAVGLGNAPTSPEVVSALRARTGHPSALVREHVAWALSRHERLAS